MDTSIVDCGFVPSKKNAGQAPVEQDCTFVPPEPAAPAEAAAEPVGDEPAEEPKQAPAPAQQRSGKDRR